jgi:uncharacterized protein YkwD
VQNLRPAQAFALPPVIRLAIGNHRDPIRRRARRRPLLALGLGLAIAVGAPSLASGHGRPGSHGRQPGRRACPRLAGRSRAACTGPRRRRRRRVVCFASGASGRRVCRPRAARDGAALMRARVRSADPTAGCPDAQTMPFAANVLRVDMATVCLVNQLRVQHGLRPMRIDSDLVRAAQRHADDMVFEDYLEHTGPAGDTPLSRIRDSGYLSGSTQAYSVGENVAWGTLMLATPAAIVRAWSASPEHLANMLDPSYSDTAVWVDPQAPPTLAQGQAGATYDQEFGGLSTSP